MRRYGYDHEARMRPMPSPHGWYPGAFWAGAPAYGLGFDSWVGYWGWPAYPSPMPGGYGRDYPPRRPPRESPTYGRGGDRALRAWARDAGHDAGYAIEPRPQLRPRYDRGW